VDVSSGLPYFFAAAVRASALYCLSQDYASLLEAASASGTSSVSTVELARTFQARVLSQAHGSTPPSSGDAQSNYIGGSQCNVMEPRVQTLRRLVTRLQSEAWRLEGLLRQQAGASADAVWAKELLDAGDLLDLQDELRRLRAKLVEVTTDRDKKNAVLMKAHRMSMVARQHAAEVED
jgi:hypothetical protein